MDVIARGAVSPGGQPRTATAAAEDERDDADRPARAKGLSGARILLVEDNEVNRMVAAEVLAGAGYVCECAGDGKSAVEAVLRGAYDLVLMDCQMPEMDGFEAARLIRGHEARAPLPGRSTPVPVIALTANALKGDRDRCLRAGMDDYLSKPLQPAKLLRMIESFLGRAGAVVAAAPGQTKERAAAAADAAAAATAAATTPAPVTGVPAPVDFDALRRRCAGSHDFAEKVLGKFRTEAAGLLESLVRGAGERDAEMATRSAHSLKGIAATVSAEALRRVAAAVEADSRGGDWDALGRQLDSLRAELDRCLAFVPRAESEAVGATASEKGGGVERFTGGGERAHLDR
jgi:Amt family ammonium transporter